MFDVLSLIECLTILPSIVLHVLTFTLSNHISCKKKMLKCYSILLCLQRIRDFHIKLFNFGGKIMLIKEMTSWDRDDDENCWTATI